MRSPVHPFLRRRAPLPAANEPLPLTVAGWPTLQVEHRHIYGPRPRQERPGAAEVWLEDAAGMPLTGRLVFPLDTVRGGQIDLSNYREMRERIETFGVVVRVGWRF